MELDGSSHMDIKKRICEDRRAIRMLNSILWSRNIINRSKEMLYEITVSQQLSCIHSIMLYGTHMDDEHTTSEEFGFNRDGLWLKSG